MSVQILDGKKDFHLSITYPSRMVNISCSRPFFFPDFDIVQGEEDSETELDKGKYFISNTVCYVQCMQYGRCCGSQNNPSLTTKGPKSMKR
jgi:hypothetical protein